MILMKSQLTEFRMDRNDQESLKEIMIFFQILAYAEITYQLFGKVKISEV